MLKLIIRYGTERAGEISLLTLQPLTSQKARERSNEGLAAFSSARVGAASAVARPEGGGGLLPRLVRVRVS